MALMTKEDVVESKSESEQGFESESEPDQQTDEVTSPLVEKLYAIITCLIRKLTKSKEWIRSLFKEAKDLKSEIDLSPLTNQVREGSSTQVQKFKEENSLLKSQVEELKGKLEKLTSSSKYLDMILGSQ